MNSRTNAFRHVARRATAIVTEFRVGDVTWADLTITGPAGNPHFSTYDTFEEAVDRLLAEGFER